MKKRITTVVLSMLLVAAMAMAIPTKASAGSHSYNVSVGSASYGLLVEGNLLSSTTAKAMVSIEHKSGPYLVCCSGYIMAYGINSSGTPYGHSVAPYEEYSVNSFSVSTTYVRSNGGLAGVIAVCDFLGETYLA